MAMIEWTPEQEAKLDEMFNKFDENQDGKITFDDIKSHCLKETVQMFGNNPTDQEIKEFCDKVDTDGDGAISKTELKQFVEEIIQALGDPRQRLMAALDVMAKAMDKDGNGLIDKEEFRVFMKEKGDCPLTDAEIDEVFEAVDIDGDKTTLTKEELFTLLQIGLMGQGGQ